MSTVFDPTALRPQSAGLEAALRPLQEALIAGLPWLSYVYGLAVNDPAEKLAPAVYTGERPGDYLRLTANDRVGALSFIDPEGPRICRQNVPPRSWEAPVAVVILANLERLKEAGSDYGNTELFPYYPTEEMLEDILRAIAPVRGFKLARIGTLRGEVCGRYDKELFSGAWPQVGFRISGSYSYVDPC